MTYTKGAYYPPQTDPEQGVEHNVADVDRRRVILKETLAPGNIDRHRIAVTPACADVGDERIACDR